MMGGLINSSTVKGDLWMIEAGGNMACYPLATTAEGPGPRVGHASLLVGNAFIVYGGDTKIDDSDVLDETLYLLNTCESSGQPNCLPCIWILTFPPLSNSALVACSTGWPPSLWKVRPFAQYLGIQDLYIWWSSRGLFHE